MRLRSRSKGIARIVSLNWWGAQGGTFIFIVLALVLFAASAINPGAMGGMRMKTADLAAPLLAAVNRPIYAAAEYVRAISGLASLQAENARLAEENARLRDWYQKALTLQSENESLQKLLNMKLPEQHTYVTAYVIADTGNAFARSLLVMAGKADGVDAGQPVLAGDGLIGRVIEAGQASARVLLLDDINSRVPVLVQGTNQRAILAGRNDRMPVLMHLPPEIEIEPGSRVITSGHGGLYPYGLPVGEVVKDAQGELAVRPYAAVDRVYMVRVISKAEDPNLRHGS